MAIDYDFNLDFDGLRARLEAAIPPALAKGMEHIHTVVTPLVPVESSHLVGAGGITVVGHEARLLYPGPYALYQHEGVYYRHGRFGAPLTHTHGQSFFLQQPMLTEGAAALRVVADELWRRL